MDEDTFLKLFEMTHRELVAVIQNETQDPSFREAAEVFLEARDRTGLHRKEIQDEEQLQDSAGE